RGVRIPRAPSQAATRSQAQHDSIPSQNTEQNTERRRERMDETQTQQRAMLAGKLVSELQAIAEQVGVKDPKKRKKADLIEAILGSVNGSNGVRREEAPSGNGAPGSESGQWRAQGPVEEASGPSRDASPAPDRREAP